MKQNNEIDEEREENEFSLIEGLIPAMLAILILIVSLLSQ